MIDLLRVFIHCFTQAKRLDLGFRMTWQMFG